MLSDQNMLQLEFVVDEKIVQTKRKENQSFEKLIKIKSNFVFISICMLRINWSTCKSTKLNMKNESFFRFENDFTIICTIQNKI
jgi:hypothetical protein